MTKKQPTLDEMFAALPAEKQAFVSRYKDKPTTYKDLVTEEYRSLSKRDDDLKSIRELIALHGITAKELFNSPKSPAAKAFFDEWEVGKFSREFKFGYVDNREEPTKVWLRQGRALPPTWFRQAFDNYLKKTRNAEHRALLEMKEGSKPYVALRQKIWEEVFMMTRTQFEDIGLDMDQMAADSAED